MNATNADDYNKSLVGINGAGTVTLASHSTFQVSGDGNGAVNGIQLSKQGGSFVATRPEKFNVDLSGNTNSNKKLITNAQGHQLNDEDAKKAISNNLQMLEGTTYTWMDGGPKTNVAGEKTGTVTVTMPGKDPVPVTVKVTVSDQDSGNGISVTKDHELKPEDARQALLNGGNKLPDDANTNISWDGPVDTGNIGTQT